MASHKPIATSSSKIDSADSQSSTRALVQRTRLGDTAAGNQLFARLVRRVRQWARSRLPREARDLSDTADVVQDAAAGVWRNLDRIGLENPGDLEAYLKQAVSNRIRDEARRVRRRPGLTDVDSQIPDKVPTQLDRVLSTERSTRFHAAFGQLTNDEREAILARHEYGYSYEEVAALLGKPSAAAARMAVNRAAARLAGLMRATRD
jgi:RNA polymerase sigma-70 factor (ECF subfamily)